MAAQQQEGRTTRDKLKEETTNVDQACVVEGVRVEKKMILFWALFVFIQGGSCSECIQGGTIETLGLYALKSEITFPITYQVTLAEKRLNKIFESLQVISDQFDNWLDLIEDFKLAYNQEWPFLNTLSFGHTYPLIMQASSTNRSHLSSCYLNGGHLYRARTGGEIKDFARLLTTFNLEDSFVFWHPDKYYIIDSKDHGLAAPYASAADGAALIRKYNNDYALALTSGENPKANAIPPTQAKKFLCFLPALFPLQKKSWWTSFKALPAKLTSLQERIDTFIKKFKAFFNKPTLSISKKNTLGFGFENLVELTELAVHFLQSSWYLDFEERDWELINKFLTQLETFLQHNYFIDSNIFAASLEQSTLHNLHTMGNPKFESQVWIEQLGDGKISVQGHAGKWAKVQRIYSFFDANNQIFKYQFKYTLGDSEFFLSNFPPSEVFHCQHFSSQAQTNSCNLILPPDISFECLTDLSQNLGTECFTDAHEDFLEIHKRTCPHSPIQWCISSARPLNIQVHCTTLSKDYGIEAYSTNCFPDCKIKTSSVTVNSRIGDDSLSPDMFHMKNGNTFLEQIEASESESDWNAGQISLTTISIILGLILLLLTLILCCFISKKLGCCQHCCKSKNSKKGREKKEEGDLVIELREESSLLSQSQSKPSGRKVILRDTNGIERPPPAGHRFMLTHE